MNLVQVPILLEQLCPGDTVHILITSSSPAASMIRRRIIGVATAGIGRLLRSVAAVVTTWTCIAPMSVQVPVSVIGAVASQSDVR